jgi:hypothetical protein
MNNVSFDCTEWFFFNNDKKWLQKNTRRKCKFIIISKDNIYKIQYIAKFKIIIENEFWWVCY